MMMKSIKDILLLCPKTNEDKIYRQAGYSWYWITGQRLNRLQRAPRFASLKSLGKTFRVLDKSENTSDHQSLKPYFVPVAEQSKSYMFDYTYYLRGETSPF